MTAAAGEGGERVVPYYCPYCSDEDLWPSEAGHGTWECRACGRAFAVRFVGLVASPIVGTGSTAEARS